MDHARPQDEDRLPSALRDRERKLVAKRRELAGVDSGKPVAALALSGGGIRSATFSLGVLQGLAKLGLLRPFDYLSTVSGGGYAGSFLGALFCRPVDAQGRRPTPEEVEAGLSAPEAPPEEGPKAIRRSVEWLRENGRYLTPGGSGDGFWAAAMVARNLVAVHLAMATVWLFGLLAMEHIGWSLGAIQPEYGKLAFLGIPMVRSPWLLASLVALPVALGLFGWAYWLVDQPAARRSTYITRPAWGMCVLWALALAAFFVPPGWAGLRLALFTVSLLGVFALGICFMAGAPPEGARRTLTEWLRLGLLLSLAVFAYGVVDTLGWTFWQHWFQESGDPKGAKGVSLVSSLFSKNGILVSAASGLLLFRDRLESLLGKVEGEGWWARMMPTALRLMVGMSGLGLALLGLGALSAIAHFLCYRLLPEGHLAARGAWPYALLLLGGVGALAVVISRTIGFLNLSTLGPTYTAALTRAYPGASNAARRDGDVAPHPIDGDDLAWKDYRPWEQGGPLHLINSTLNETTGGKSQVVQKDRKGLILCVGPAGLSVAVRHHALWAEGGAKSIGKQGGHAVFGPSGTFIDPEPLTLGQWVGISGAAASTAMGSRTSLLYSLWLGFLNVRLGYWWWSGTKPGTSLRTVLEGLFPVHAHLLEEWTAHLPGTHSRHWYLTDGGHFENTGAYELIRRRVPFILLCDNGADRERELDDLSNLVAKARMDLAAEIRVLDAQALQARFKGKVPPFLGDLDQLRSQEGEALAALADIDYLDARGAVALSGTLLILKPTLAPEVPLDLQAYHRAHPDFPQQSTGDQFFDEAQWESYRCLGEFTVLKVLGAQKGLHPSDWFGGPRLKRRRMTGRWTVAGWAAEGQN